VNGIKTCDERRIKRQSIRLNEWKRIMGLRFHIDAHHLETRSGVTDACTPCTTEQVEQSGLFCRRLEDVVAVQ
jgi:hypothetical protein